jgi:hypothetical protein
MDRTSTPSGHTLHCALELSKNSWLLAIQFPDRPQPSIYAIEGGNTEKLMTKLTAARDSWGKMSGAVPAITVCLGSALVPSTPEIDRHLGRHVAGVAKESGGIEWSFGRKRGVEI